MNLKEIKAKLHDGFYASREEIKRDLYLIAANAKEYNRDGRGGDAIWLMADMYEKNLTQSKSGFALVSLPSLTGVLLYSVVDRREDTRNQEIEEASRSRGQSRSSGPHA